MIPKQQRDISWLPRRRNMFAAKSALLPFEMFELRRRKPSDGVAVAPYEQTLRTDWMSKVVSLWQTLAASIPYESPLALMQQIEAAAAVCPDPETVSERLALRCLLLEVFIQLSARIARLPDSDAVRGRSNRIWTGGQHRLGNPIPPFKLAAKLLLDFADEAAERPLHERARRWLDANWSAKTPSKRMAVELHAHPKTLARHFRGAFDMTVQEYRQQCQVARGIQLLRETDIKVEAVALLVGCKSKATFYRLLWKSTGMRPAEIRALR